MKNDGITIFRASTKDIDVLTQLFRDTIQNINSKDYPADEIEDWSSWWTDYDKWYEKIENQYFLKAMKNDNIVGICSLSTDGYLDLMFTHKDFQNQGVASSMIKKIEKKANEQGNNIIYSDVSITAKQFFERHGYVVEKKQLKKSKNKELINFRMTKCIN